MHLIDNVVPASMELRACSIIESEELAKYMGRNTE